jgi:integrase
MSVGKITKSVVDRLPPGVMLWDTTLIGFGVRRQRRGAFYLLRYRIAGRQRFRTIGRHGSPWTPDTARREATRLLGVVAGGVDPAQRSEPVASTFGAEVARYLERQRASLKPRSFIETQRNLLRHAAPLHDLALTDITRRAIAVRLGEIETTSGPVSRNRVRASLSAFFAWAIREGLTEINPVTGTGRAAETSRTRVLTQAELAELWAALDESPYSDIVRLLILTGQRRAEIGWLRWSEIDFDRGLIVLAPARTKNKRLHEVSLSAPAFAILQRRWIIHGERAEATAGRSEFIFGIRGFKGWARHKARIDRKLSFADYTLHDIRRSVATGMAEIGVQPHIIEAVLNHVSGHRAGVAGIYNRASYAGPMREALTRWADWVAALTK